MPEPRILRERLAGQRTDMDEIDLREALQLGGGFEVMKKIKRALDPENIMNPGKYLLDQAYDEGDA